MSTNPMIRNNKTWRLPKWISEHIQLGGIMDDFTLATLKTMEENGRARNIHRIDHSGKQFVQFERRLQLKFKRMRNEK